MFIVLILACGSVRLDTVGQDINSKLTIQISMKYDMYLDIYNWTNDCKFLIRNVCIRQNLTVIDH